MVRLAPSFRLLATLLAVLAALLLGACGGDESTAQAEQAQGTVPAGAELVPASVPVFLTFDTDFASQQWTTLDSLLAQFPSGDEAISSLLEKIAGEGVDVEAELKPAFGPETSIAILELDQAALDDRENAPVVLLTKPADPAKLEALLAKGSDKAVSEETTDGWYVVADNQQIIDQVLQGAAADSLADTPAFIEAMQGLPADSFARLFVNGPPLVASLQKSMAESSPSFDLGSLGLGSAGGSLSSVAMALRAEARGVRLDGVVETEGGQELTVGSYEPALPSVVPSDVIAYFSFANTRAAIEQLLQLAGQQQGGDFQQQLGQIEAAFGVSLEQDILPLFEGEHAFYVRFAAPVPELTLLLTPADPVKGLATLDKLTSALSLFAGASDGNPPQLTTTSVAGIPTKQLSFPGSNWSLYYAQVGKNLVFTTAVQGIADLAAPSAVLADDPLFVEASEQGGLTDSTQGFAYVNPAEALELFAVFPEQASQIPIDPKTLQGLDAIRYFIVNTAAAQNEATFTGFLAIGD
jgi:Protein of unknown function (DUF3352)